MAKLNAEYDQVTAKERDLIARRDKRMAAKGYTHRVTAWVHAGGDDRQIDFYVKGTPSDAFIKKALRKEGSRVLDDYSVVTLKK